MKTILRWLVLLVAVAVTGCAWTSRSGQLGEQLTIRAFIDGSDELKVQGDKIWYVHRNFNLPGRWEGADEPTYVNGKAWKPRWNDKVSEPFTQFAPMLPAMANDSIRLVVNEARGRVEVVEHPSMKNAYTLTMRFDDDGPLGAAWYDVSIGW